MLEEPRAGRLAAWSNALLGGQAPPDDAARGVTGDDGEHLVRGLPGAEEPLGLMLAFGRMRALGVVALRVALPVPGHPLGLCGPPEFNSAALEAGQAVLAPEAGLGLVPEISGSETADPNDPSAADVTWWYRPVARDAWPDVPSVGEAERELTEELRSTTEGLLSLGVPTAGRAAAAELEAYRARSERHRSLLAPGYPARAVRVLELAQRVGELLAIAAAPGHDTALSAGQGAARDELLRPLAHSARRAQVAAYNARAEEVERRRTEGR